MSSLTFNCAIISPSAERGALYSKELRNSPFVGSANPVNEYLASDALARLLRLDAIDMMIVDCQDLERGLDLISTVRTSNPSVEVVAVCEENVNTLASLLRLGVRDYIPADASISVVRNMLAESIARLSNKPQLARTSGDVVAFLPSKPGCGASTIAANVALAAAASAKRRVLLSDFDRDAPVQSFLHRLHPEHYLQEAIDSAFHLDTDIWSRLVSQRGNLDILPSDANGAMFENARTQQLLEFIRRAYDLVCVDLPGPLDPSSGAVLLEARRVYLVCTQELASVHIALRKADRLRRLGVEKQVRLLVNRYVNSHVMTADRISDLVGLPVELTIPNSYALATASAEQGTQVDSKTALGKSYSTLVQLFYNERVEVPRKQRSFLEYLYLPFQKQSKQTA